MPVSAGLRPVTYQQNRASSSISPDAAANSLRELATSQAGPPAGGAERSATLARTTNARRPSADGLPPLAERRSGRVLIPSSESCRTSAMVACSGAHARNSLVGLAGNQARITPSSFSVATTPNLHAPSSPALGDHQCHNRGRAQLSSSKTTRATSPGWRSAPHGFVLNCGRPPSPSYLMLHRATCRTINGAPGRKWTVSYQKVCGDTLDEVLTWAGQIGPPSGCGICKPG